MPTSIDAVFPVDGPFRLGEWLVEPGLNRLSRGNDVLQIELKAMDVLVYLTQRSGEVVSRFELQDAVWQTEFVADNTLVKRIAQLREALGDDVRQPRYIETIPKRGYRLIAEVSFEAPGQGAPGLLEGTPEAAERSPYPGLAPFTEDDAAEFFGREAEIALLWRKITNRRLLAVVGASGAGKSSLLRAGVVARAPPGWRAVVCQPGGDPFLAVARAMAQDLTDDPEEIGRLLAFQDPEVALAVAARWRGRWGEALLVVDQFEELFTLNPEPAQERFAELLRRAVDAAGIHVVLVLRDDFLLACHRHRQLAPVFSDLTPIGPPVGRELRRALVEPAARRLVGFESELMVEEMVGQVERERGALPLLAFAASELWERRDRERRLLTREAYERIGGVAGALARHAEATLDAIGPERRSTVRELFRNLVTAEGTRAAREWSELLSVFLEQERGAAEQVLRALIDARLLTSYELRGDGEDPTRRVEIVHESLLRAWPRLERWRAQDADGALLRDQLRQAADLWNARGRPTELLWTGAPYLEFRAWRESYPGGLSAIEEAYAHAMTAHAGRRRRRRRVATAAAVLAAVAVAAVTTTLWRRSEDRSLRLEERRLIETAHQTMSQSPPEAFAYSLAALELRDSPEARTLALGALWASPMPLVIGHEDHLLSSIMAGVDFSPDGRWLAVGQLDGHIALWPDSGGPPLVWQPHASRCRGYFVPDGKALVSVSAAEPELVVWSVPKLERLGTSDASWPRKTEINAREANIANRLCRVGADPSAPAGWGYDHRALDVLLRLASDRLPAAAVSPDGEELVYANGEEVYRLSVAGPAPTQTRIVRAPSAVDFIAWSPRGAALATTHDDGTTRLWSLESGVAEPLLEWPRVRDSSCNDLLFDPAGSLLVTAFDDGTASVRALDDPPGSDPLLLAPRGSRLVQLAFHPGGSWLATAGMRRVCLWPLDQARRPLVLRGHTGGVERVAFAPDGSWLASCGTDGTVRRWPLAAAAGVEAGILYDWGHLVEWFVSWMALAPDGRFLVTTGDADSARLVPLDGTAPRSLGGFDQRVLRAAVDPQSRRVAVPGYVGGRPVVRVWDLASGAVTDISFDAPPDDPLRFQLLGIELTSDGRLLAADGHQLVAVDLASGGREALAEGVADFAVARRGRLILGRNKVVDREGIATIHDLDSGTATRLQSHGAGVFAVTLDAGGAVAVTGSDDGIVRVGPSTGEEPHWLVGHQGRVTTVAVSPDGRWIASGGIDGTIRLWPMPNLAETPLNALPHPELLARLRALTNLRVVRDPEDPESSVVRAGPFPGRRTTPSW